MAVELQAPQFSGCMGSRSTVACGWSVERVARIGIGDLVHSVQPAGMKRVEQSVQTMTMLHTHSLNICFSMRRNDTNVIVKTNRFGAIHRLAW
jgi:hypothetical protein